MKYQNPELRQMLAAEYALGTLRGAARRRFERLLARDPALAAERNLWEQRLAGLALRVAPVAPRELVWAAIDRSINSSKTAALPERKHFQDVNFWRAWAIAASVACFGVAFKLWQQVSEGPQMIPSPFVVQVPVKQPATYVAMLQPGGDTQFQLSLAPDKGLFKVSASGSKHPVDYNKRSLELWVLDDAGKPHSLGVMPEQGEMQMPWPKDMPMPNKPVLAVSDEPKGGSPTGQPTGPVLTAGPVLRSL